VLAGALLAGCSPAQIVNGLVPSTSYRLETGMAYGPQPRQQLDVYRPLAEAGSGLLDTVTAYAESGSTLEGAARALFVHPNTVRYRLRRVAEVCGRAPTDPRDLLTLQLALVLGRLEDQG